MTQLTKCEPCLAWPACRTSQRCLARWEVEHPPLEEPASCVGSGATGWVCSHCGYDDYVDIPEGRHCFRCEKRAEGTPNSQDQP